MFVGLSDLVELRVRAGGPLSHEERKALHDSLARDSGAHAPESLRTDELTVDRVGRRMSAELLAREGDFRIEPLSSAVQDGHLAETLAWDWRVTPGEAGRGVLRVRMTVKRDADGRELEIDARALEAVVNIRVGSRRALAGRVLRREWKWVVATLIAAGGLAVAALRYLFPAGD